MSARVRLCVRMYLHMFVCCALYLSLCHLAHDVLGLRTLRRQSISIVRRCYWSRPPPHSHRIAPCRESRRRRAERRRCRRRSCRRRQLDWRACRTQTRLCGRCLSGAMPIRHRIRRQADERNEHTHTKAAIIADGGEGAAKRRASHRYTSKPNTL